MKYFNSPAHLALIPLLLAAAFPSMAQHGPDSSVTVLENVIVTGVAPQSALTFVTDPKKPRQPLPASDGTDYLKTIPGFSAIRNGGSNGDPVLRGMFGSRLNILVNGTTMLGACPSRMDTPSSYISPATFDTLTVVKGPQSVLWGPVGSAGTIRFDREAPGFTEPGILFDGSITGGSWGRHDQTLDLAAGNEKVYVRATGNRSHSQDYKDGDGNIVPSRWSKWNADLAVGLTPDADTLIELTAGTGDGEARYAGRGMDGSKFKRESLGLRFAKDNIGNTLKKLEAQVYYNYADHVMDNYSLRHPDPNANMMMRSPRASNVDRATWGGRFAATLTLTESMTLVTGVDYQENSHRKRAGGTNYTSLPREKDASFSNSGLFAELTWQASDAGRLITGARVDRADAKDYRQTTGMGMMTKPNPTAGEQRRKTLTSGFVRYEHDLSSLPATLYVGLGHAERYPDYWELFSPGNGPQGTRNAFEGIKPEKTTQLDFGAQYRNDTWDAWFSGYVGQVHDYILFDYAPKGLMGSQARNIKANIMGAELGASYKLTPQWTLGGSLAYAWGENRSDSTPMAQMPPLEVRLNAGYDNGVWSAGALWRVVAKQTRYSPGHGNVVSKDFGPSSGFGIASVNGGYAFNKHAKLTVGVDNLLNKTYHEHLNLAGATGFGYSANTQINEPGRTIWANLALKF